MAEVAKFHLRLHERQTVKLKFPSCSRISRKRIVWMDQPKCEWRLKRELSTIRTSELEYSRAAKLGHQAMS